MRRQKLDSKSAASLLNLGAWLDCSCDRSNSARTKSRVCDYDTGRDLSNTITACVVEVNNDAARRLDLAWVADIRKLY